MCSCDIVKVGLLCPCAQSLRMALADWMQCSLWPEWCKLDTEVLALHYVWDLPCSICDHGCPDVTLEGGAGAEVWSEGASAPAGAPTVG